MRPVFFYKSQPSPSQQNSGLRWWLFVWSPVLIAISVILMESTDTFSSQHTSEWLRPVIQRWFGAFTDAHWDLFHHYLRKTGHFLGYGTIGLTFLRAWLYTLASRGTSTLLAWRQKSSLFAVLSTAFIASCDEFHQSFIPSRTGTPLDVLLDTSGAFMLCSIVWLICWAGRDRNQAA